MKKLYYKSFLGKIRKSLLAILLSVSMPMMADGEWKLVFHNAFGEEHQTSFVVADKNGNSQLVQELIFKQ